MKKLFVECSNCHHMVLPNKEEIPILIKILGGVELYTCKNCNKTMDFFFVHVCYRDLTDECKDCKFRFLCYTNAAT